MRDHRIEEMVVLMATSLIITAVAKDKIDNSIGESELSLVNKLIILKKNENNKSWQGSMSALGRRWWTVLGH